MFCISIVEKLMFTVTKSKTAQGWRRGGLTTYYTILLYLGKYAIVYLINKVGDFMKLPKDKFNKKLVIAAALFTALLGGTAVYALKQDNSSQQTTIPVATVAPVEAPQETVEVKEEPVATPVVAPTTAPKPVVAQTPATPTPEELKAAAKAAVIGFAESQGMKGGTGIGDPLGQWVCMEKFFIRDSVTPENYMAYINKNMIVGDHDPSREGNQRYFFNGAGTCGVMVYTR